MEIRKVEEKISKWNKLAGHPMQSWEWGEFRKLTGTQVARYGIFKIDELVEPVTVTIHPIPHTPWTIGYYPKGGKITSEHKKILGEIAKHYNCIYIKCEPKIESSNQGSVTRGENFRKGRSLFTPHNFVLDVSRSEEELLAGMKQKTRYNIRVAEKKGVKVEIDNSDEAFSKYLELTRETTERQGFYAHSPRYFSTMWSVLGNHQTLNPKSQIYSNYKNTNNILTADIMTAKYQNKIITTWVLFTHNDTLYYPYGASTREQRNLMANNLVMWEAIKLAKRKGLKYLDMWGALGPEPDKTDPWYGFHKFKEGYGGRHITYIGSWDYTTRPLLYSTFRVVEEMRWKILRLLK